MSGEYYCIEEVPDTKGCYGEYEESDSKSNDKNRMYKNIRDDAQSTTSKKSQDYRLHDEQKQMEMCMQITDSSNKLVKPKIEDQLEVAENRCNTLKVQLESMKQMYHGSNSPKSSRSPEGRLPSHQHKIGSGETSFVQKHNRKRTASSNRRTQRQATEFRESNQTIPQKSSTSSECVHSSTPYMQARGMLMTSLDRQNSNCIGTDHSGAAVRTINNILSGITNSANRFSKFPVETKVDKNVKKHGRKETFAVSESGFSYGATQHHSNMLQQEHEDRCQPVVGVHDVVLDKLSSNSVKAKQRWSRHTSSKIQSNKIQAVPNMSRQIKSTLKHMENVSKKGPLRPSSTLPESESQSAIFPRKRKRTLKRLKQASKSSLMTVKMNASLNLNDQLEPTTSNNLVELYHNIAAKSSDSDSALCSKSNVRQKGGGDLPVVPIHIPPPNLEQVMPNKPAIKTHLTTINENGYSDLNGIVNDCNLNLIKNYELPTIASRMKQVNKQFLNSFSFRTIPFCTTKSITPSHNIGINIQQVMNILKTRQPITGISPTLAHNIGLAAGKLESHHLSTLVSTLSSRLGYGRSQCPLLKVPFNFLPIQGIPRGIPEDQFQQPNGFNNEVQENINLNGAAGDREEVPPRAVWTVDPEIDKRCTCAPPKGVPLQQVLRKYQQPSEFASTRSKSATGPRLSTPKPGQSTRGITPRKQRIRNWIKNDVQRNTQAAKAREYSGKEKNLKVVLKNLHDEFETLNTKYEELSKQVGTDDPNERTTKELEEMEGELNKKEEEINTVMSLFKEVLALKDQVKKLREKASQPSLIMAPIGSVSEYKEPKTAQHLTQLLKQIQNYQLHCKNKV